MGDPGSANYLPVVGVSGCPRHAMRVQSRRGARRSTVGNAPSGCRSLLVRACRAARVLAWRSSPVNVELRSRGVRGRRWSCCSSKSWCCARSGGSTALVQTLSAGHRLVPRASARRGLVSRETGECVCWRLGSPTRAIRPESSPISSTAIHCGRSGCIAPLRNDDYPGSEPGVRSVVPSCAAATIRRSAIGAAGSGAGAQHVS